MIVSTAGVASAQEHGGARYPVSYTERPLVLPAMVIAPELEVAVQTGKISGFPTGFNLHPAIGARMGIIDGLEVHAVVLPFNFYSPPSVDTAAGSFSAPSQFRYGNPEIGATFQFLKGDFEVGASAGIRIPTKSGDLFGFDLGVPVHIHLGKSARIDTGAFFNFNPESPLEAISAVSSSTSVIIERDNAVGINIPLAFAYDIAEPFHVGVNTGFRIFNFKDAGKNIDVPLGVFFGYAVGGDKGPVVDIDPFFQWPAFLIPGSDGDKVNPGFVEFGLNVTGYLYL